MEEKTLLEYWYVLYSRKWIILSVIITAVFTAWILSNVIPPVYETKAVFFVPEKPDTTNFFTPSGGASARSPLTPIAKEDTQGPYIGILKSKAIAELVQKEFPHKTIQDLMRKDTDFVLTNEYLIEVYARDKDPVKAAGIANAYVKYFNQLMGGYSLPSQSRIQTTLEDEISLNQKKYLDALDVLRSFQERNRIANLDEETRQLISQKTSFESQLETYQIAYNENKNKISSTERELKNELDILNASELIVTSPLLEAMKKQLVDMEIKIASMGVEYKESHPDSIALKKGYETVKKGMDTEVEKIIKSQVKAPDTFHESLRRQLINLYVDREKVAASIESTKMVLKGMQERLSDIPNLKKQIDYLSVDMDRNKKLVDTLKVNLEEAKAQTKRAPQVVVPVDNATPPSKPSFPVLWLNLFVASLAGFIGGVFYAFFVHYLEETREKRVYTILKAIKASEV